MVHTVYIYHHEWLICMVNVGKYTKYGSYGQYTLPETNPSKIGLLGFRPIF